MDQYDIFENLFVLELANNHWGSLKRAKQIVRELHPLYLCAAARLRTSWFLLRINRTDLKPSVSHLGLAHQYRLGGRS